VTGPEAARLFQERTRRLNEIAARLKVPEHEVVNAVERLSARVKELERKPKGDSPAADIEALVQTASPVGDTSVLVRLLPDTDANSLRDISDRVRQKLGDAVVVLGSESDGRVHLVANVAPSVVDRGVSAAHLVRTAAPIVGGGGGGRDTLAQAGGKDPEKLDEALATARAEIEKALA
jgi:alanyl-tRNA synthetase